MSCQGKPQPKLIEIECPNCGEMVEMVSTDVVATCEACGRTVLSDAMNCVLWCDKAAECVGQEIVDRVMSDPDLVQVDLDAFRRFMR